jgi:hypothetical protein
LGSLINGDGNQQHIFAVGDLEIIYSESLVRPCSQPKRCVPRRNGGKSKERTLPRHLRNIIFDRTVLSKWSTDFHLVPCFNPLSSAQLSSALSQDLRLRKNIIDGEAIALKRNMLGREITEVEIGSDLRPRSGNMARAISSQRAKSKSKLLPLFKGPMKESRAKRGEQIVTLYEASSPEEKGLGYGR